MLVLEMCEKTIDISDAMDSAYNELELLWESIERVLSKKLCCETIYLIEEMNGYLSNLISISKIFHELRGKHGEHIDYVLINKQKILWELYRKANQYVEMNKWFKSLFDSKVEPILLEKWNVINIQKTSFSDRVYSALEWYIN